MILYVPSKNNDTLCQIRNGGNAIYETFSEKYAAAGIFFVFVAACHHALGLGLGLGFAYVHIHGYSRSMIQSYVYVTVS